MRDLPSELTSLVKWSVARLGEAIRIELGDKKYHQIEILRREMAALRQSGVEPTKKSLHRNYQLLSKLKPSDRMEIARAFTLMLELMNACENAYRTHRLKQRNIQFSSGPTEKVYYVLTAHPTEARSPRNIEIFFQIQGVLIQALKSGLPGSEKELDFLLETAWKTTIVRQKKPTVKDEAEHLYSVVMREQNLSMLLDIGMNHLPVFIRSWVGGDKDGHPGVDEHTLTASLQLSRDHLEHYLKLQIQALEDWTHLFRRPEIDLGLTQFKLQCRKIRLIRPRDGENLGVLKKSFRTLQSAIAEEFQSPPKAILRIEQLFKIFPGLVIPLELREDSGILVGSKDHSSLAIFKMLKKIRVISGKTDPCAYARGFIVSMSKSAEHITLANRISKKAIGSFLMPIVPLFEQKVDLEAAPEILSALFRTRVFRKIIRTQWNNTFEVMLGYSDSAKDAGVLPSRLAISKAMQEIEKVGKKFKVRIVFFQGSGGSIDRGGGRIGDQMSSWSASAIETYKATLQGEMVERTFAHPDIFKSQVFQISHARTKKVSARSSSQILGAFSKEIEKHYRGTVGDEAFLQLIEKATPYSFLSALKMGSRPTKRSTELRLTSLRAIPWILCWTQTRVLFPTWWGVGSAWNGFSVKLKSNLKKAYRDHPTFHAYIYALAFTLAKVELAVFETYLETSNLDRETVERFRNLFRREYSATLKFIRELTGKNQLLWRRPWLGKSIELRAPMIHPLNLLEIIAQKENDLALLRVAVTGIASGMMTTG